MADPGLPKSDPTRVPPEVPDEFADAYRAAYERALAAQSEVGTHRSASSYDKRDARDPRRVPRGVAPLRVGTHRTGSVDGPGAEPSRTDAADAPTEGPEEGRREREHQSVLPRSMPQAHGDFVDPTRYERVRDSGFFVPMLLLLLVVLLVLGAYVLGRAFSGSVGKAEGASGASDTSLLQ